MTQKNNTEKQLTTAAGTPAAIIEKVLLQGDLSALTPEERLNYYKSVCESLGLNPLTKPFDYIVLDRKLVLYARKDATEQLRKRHSVSITDLTTNQLEDVFVVTAKAKDDTGRTDAATGAVSLEYTDDGGTTHKLRGIGLANAIMKAETKAKRRVTLSICGLGMFDESELDTVTSPPSEAIVERNVKEATAHATGESFELPKDKGIIQAMRENEYGPLVITEDNYKELKSHVGKAQGNMLGYKVGELHRNVVEWMYKNWREKLPPSASEQDMRLSKAIQFAFHAPQEGKEGDATSTPLSKSESALSNAAPTVQPAGAAEDIGAKQACLTDLRGRIENLALTEELACGYLHKFGLFGEGWTSFNDSPTALLLHLCTPHGWKTFKDLYEKESKPKVVEKPPLKRTRKRAAK